MEIWYCPEYPVEAINYSKVVFRPDWDHYRPQLLENIKQQGLVNPLILMNHRPKDQFKERWLKVGNNRMWAILQLGWKTVPVVITGECEYEPKEYLGPENLNKYIKDGKAVIKPEAHGGIGTIIMQGHCLPENLEYPNG